MSKRISSTRVKCRQAYTIKEAATTLNVHYVTIRRWIKQGLKVVDSKTKPILIMGEDLIEFLDKKRGATKCPLEDDEFYCFRCKCAQRSNKNDIHYDICKKSAGKNQKLILVKGKCEICQTELNRLATEDQLNRILRDEQ